MDSLTWGLEDYIKKSFKKHKTNYCHQTQRRQHKYEQNNNRWEKEIGSKTTVWIYQATNWRNLSWTWLRKEKPQREIESLLITAENNAIKTNYVKGKLDKTQQNSKSRLCRDKDEMINRIISERSKPALGKYKTQHDWVWKVIHWELCKKLKVNPIN